MSRPRLLLRLRLKRQLESIEDAPWFDWSKEEEETVQIVATVLTAVFVFRFHSVRVCVALYPVPVSVVA